MLILLLLLSGAIRAEPSLEEVRVLTEIEMLDRQALALDEEIRKLDAEVAERLATVSAQGAAREEAEAKLSAGREATRGRVQALYRLRRGGYARLLFSAEDPQELRARAHYLRSLLLESAERTATISETLKSREEAAKAEVAEGERLDAARAALLAKQAALATERGARAAVLQKIRGSSTLSMAAMREHSAAQASFSVEAVAEKGIGSEQDFRSLKGKLPAPVDGPVVRGFGVYSDATSGSVGQNLGVDFSVPAGTPFRAVADGTVTQAKYMLSYGLVVQVSHGEYTTVYANAGELFVGKGQAVAAGSALGKAGTTGLSEASAGRLHFEVRYNGTAQDPAGWLKAGALRCAAGVKGCG